MNAARQQPALKLLGELLRSHSRQYGWFAVATGALALLELLPPRLFGYFTTETAQLTSMTEASAWEFLQQFALFGLIIAVVLFAAQFGWELAKEWIFLKTEATVRRIVLRRLHQLPIEELDSGQRGDWLTRVSTDLAGVEQFVAQTLPGDLRTVLVFLGVAGTFLWYDGLLAAFLLVTAGLLAWGNVWIHARLRPVMEQLRDVHGSLMQLLLESYEGLPTIRSLGAEAHMSTVFERRLGTIVHRGFKLVRTKSLVGESNGLVTTLLTTGCLTFVAWRVRGSQLTVGEALLYPFYLGLFYSSAMALVGIVGAWNRYLIEGGRLGAFLYEAHHEDATLVALPPPPVLEIRGLEVGYQGQQSLTRPFDLQVKRGEMLLVCGPSGCGKSTLLQMLAGLRAFQAAKPPGLGGVLPAAVAGSRWRLPLDWSVLVEQRPFLFEGPLRVNLAPGRQDLADEVLWEALRRVNLEDFVRAAGGLDFELQDMGRNLSEGQKYRIILARALLLDRPFLLLDEPFASLDPRSVACVVEALHGLRAQGRGLVIVSHVTPPGLEPDTVLDFGGLEADDSAWGPSSREEFFHREPGHRLFGDHLKREDRT